MCCVDGMNVPGCNPTLRAFFDVMLYHYARAAMADHRASPYYTAIQPGYTVIVGSDLHGRPCVSGGPSLWPYGRQRICGRLCGLLTYTALEPSTRPIQLNVITRGYKKPLRKGMGPAKNVSISIKAVKLRARVFADKAIYG